MDNKIGKKLNAVWEELRKLPDLFTQLFERQKKLEDKLVDNQKAFEQAVDKFAVIVADSNNGEKTVVGTVNIENLYEEIDKALKENASEPFSLDYEELGKLFDKNTPRESIKLENVQELAQELKKILPKNPEKLFIGDKKIEVFGKALVKIDGNAANNPIFVQLSDGKSPIDLKEIFNVKVAVNGGGGGGGQEPVAKFDTLIDKSGFPIIYVGEAVAGTIESASAWRVAQIDKTDPTQPKIRYADKTAEFVKSWTDRASYDYTP